MSKTYVSHYVFDDIFYEQMIVFAHREIFISRSDEEKRALNDEKYIFSRIREGFKLIDSDTIKDKKEYDHVLETGGKDCSDKKEYYKLMLSDHGNKIFYVRKVSCMSETIKSIDLYAKYESLLQYASDYEYKIVDFVTKEVIIDFSCDESLIYGR